MCRPLLYGHGIMVNNVYEDMRKPVVVRSELSVLITAGRIAKQIRRLPWTGKIAMLYRSSWFGPISPEPTRPTLSTLIRDPPRYKAGKKP